MNSTKRCVRSKYRFVLNKRFVSVSILLIRNFFHHSFFHHSSIRLRKSMNKIETSSTKQSPFDQIKTSTNVPTTSFKCRAPERVMEQHKIDPFGVLLSNAKNSPNTSHINKLKPAFSVVLDPFGSDEIDGTLNRTVKWKKVPEVGSIVSGSLKMTSKHNGKEFGIRKNLQRVKV